MFKIYHNDKNFQSQILGRKRWKFKFIILLFYFFIYFLLFQRNVCLILLFTYTDVCQEPTTWLLRLLRVRVTAFSSLNEKAMGNKGMLLLCVNQLFARFFRNAVIFLPMLQKYTIQNELQDLQTSIDADLKPNAV